MLDLVGGSYFEKYLGALKQVPLGLRCCRKTQLVLSDFYFLVIS